MVTFLMLVIMGVATIEDKQIKIICPNCCRATIGIILEISYTIRAGRYISCMHCGHRFKDPYAGIKDCMKHSSYVKENGVVKQKR